MNMTMALRLTIAFVAVIAMAKQTDEVLPLMTKATHGSSFILVSVLWLAIIVGVALLLVGAKAIESLGKKFQ